MCENSVTLTGTNNTHTHTRTHNDIYTHVCMYVHNVYNSVIQFVSISSSVGRVVIGGGAMSPKRTAWHGFAWVQTACTP